VNDEKVGPPKEYFAQHSSVWTIVPDHNQEHSLHNRKVVNSETVKKWGDLYSKNSPSILLAVYDPALLDITLCLTRGGIS